MKRLSSSVTWLCAVAALASSGGPAAADDLVGLPAYPGAAPVPLDGRLLANDVPMEAMVFGTPDDLETVLQYYQKALEARGKKVARHRFGPASGYVGYFDLRLGTMRLVTAVATPQGGTMLIFSSMDPLSLAGAPAAVPPDLPSLPGAVEVVTSESRQGPSRTRTVTFRLPGLDPEKARALLFEAAQGQGFRPDGGKSPFGDQTLVLRRGDDLCTIQVRAAPSQKENQPSASVTLLVVEGNGE